MCIRDRDKSVTIHYLNGHYGMAGFGSDEYPMMQNESDIRFDMDAATLCNSIDQSLFAVSYDALRPVMTGINYTISDGKLECAASDGHKLVRNTYPLAGNADDCRFVLSAKAAKIVKLLLHKKEGSVEVEYNGRNIVFKTGTDSFSTRLIEGTYPNYNAIVPTNSNKEATIDRQALLSAIRRVGVFAERTSRQLVLSFSGMALLLTGHDFDNATSAEETVFCTYQGDEVHIAFHAENLKMILENMDTAEVRFLMSEACRAAIIEPVSSDVQSEHLALLMPMMLPE